VSMIYRIPVLLRTIKFSHSIFALPFGLMTLFIAERGLPDSRVLVLVVLAMVGARTAAMAFNRIVDRDIDAANPRTVGRELPSGLVGRTELIFLVVVGSAAFFLAAGLLNLVALVLSPLVLAVLLGYSFAKRYTWACHFFLGAALGLSPPGAWVAVKGEAFLESWWLPVLLSGAVLLWTAGFDIIYACQDRDHDLGTALHSIPKRLGIARALWVSRCLHAGTVALLMAVVVMAPLGAFAFAGVMVVAGILVWEHRLVAPDDLSRVDAAFFTANGLVSLVLLAFTVADVLLLGGSS